MFEVFCASLQLQGIGLAFPFPWGTVGSKVLVSFKQAMHLQKRQKCHRNDILTEAVFFCVKVSC